MEKNTVLVLYFSLIAVVSIMFGYFAETISFNDSLIGVGANMLITMGVVYLDDTIPRSGAKQK